MWFGGGSLGSVVSNQACTTTSGMPSRRATPAAQRSASREFLEPSSPTTTRAHGVVGSVASGMSITEQVACCST
jgi:hypothetical protein